MKAEDIPQSVVDAAVGARVPEGQRSVYVAEWFRDGLVDALAEYERLGSQLIRYDEKMVGRAIEAAHGAYHAHHDSCGCRQVGHAADFMARAALDAALRARLLP